jgi:L-rhamnose mutarotase
LHSTTGARTLETIQNASRSPTRTDDETESSTMSTTPRPGERVCFQLQVDPARLDEYRERHAAVWPDMLRAIEASGRRNYSLFLRDDGLLIGYYETDDDRASQAALEADPRTAAWEAEMAAFFVALDGRPDQGAPRLAEVFHLEDQLAALAAER